jgi:phage head maturation protease
MELHSYYSSHFDALSKDFNGQISQKQALDESLVDLNELKLLHEHLVGAADAMRLAIQ